MFAPYQGKCHTCGRDETQIDIASDLISNEVKLKSLLRRSVKQLEAWQKAYGDSNPSWLPPNGEVKLLEDISEALDGVNKMKKELDEARKLTPEQLNTPFNI